MTVSWAQARIDAYAAAEALPPESVPLQDAVGRVLVRDLCARIDVPHYASSAMDGWAVAGDGPWTLVADRLLRPGEATPIVTGGLVPAEARAVLRSENGEVGDGILRRNQDAAPHEPTDGMHIRPAGEEARAGERVFSAGDVLNPARIAVAAVCGYDELEVAGIVNARLVLTGDEVVTEGVPAPGYVRDSFGPQLPALLGMMGVRAHAVVHLPDRLPLLLEALHETEDDAARLLVTTGGTGHSDVDHLREALHRLGADLIVDGIRMRPGSPSLLARLPGGRFVVGLPGNPLAAIMGALTLVRPLVAGLQGVPLPEPRRVRLADDVHDGAGRTRLLPYVETVDGARPSDWRGAGMLRGLGDADGVLVVPPAGVRRGEVVPTIPLPWKVGR